jgi:Tfp pilus assembly protein FimT
MTRQVNSKGSGPQPQSEQGFGALEPLLTAVSLLLVILAGQPLVSLLQGGSPKHLLQQPSLISHLEYARQEAIRQEVTVTICPSTDGRNCQVGGNWQQGWLIFTDETLPHRHLSVGDKFLHRQQGLLEQQPELAFDIIRYEADGSLLLN